MFYFIEAFQIVVAVLVLVPSCLLFVECLFGCTKYRSTTKQVSQQRPSVDVLIPAHDEATVIGDTLRSILPQLSDQDRLLVVADNCTDATANIARSMGAEVVERFDDTNCAKGFAIDAGLAHLESDFRDVVIMVDADCTVEPGGIGRLAQDAVKYDRPMQACYEMPNANRAEDAWSAVSEFAVMVKNQIRPQGLKRLGFDCVLTGSGMAFPSDQVRIPTWASNNIVEDMRNSYDLILANRGPQYCPSAHVTAALPTKRASAMQQRRRWEHGHLQTLVEQSPRLMWASVVSFQPRFLVAAFDLMIPPLSLFVQVWTAVFIGTMISTLVWHTSWAGVVLVGFAGACLSSAILIAWAARGRQVLSFRRLCMVPVYVLSKVPLYLSAVFGRQREWNRTSREEVKPCT